MKNHAGFKSATFTAKESEEYSSFFSEDKYLFLQDFVVIIKLYTILEKKDHLAFPSIIYSPMPVYTGDFCRAEVSTSKSHV